MIVDDFLGSQAYLAQMSVVTHSGHKRRIRRAEVRYYLPRADFRSLARPRLAELASFRPSVAIG